MDTGVLGSSTDEAGPLQPFTPNLTTAFFFVNETIDSPAYKVGHRQDIRSHLRKEVVRQFKQRHKSGGRGDAAQPKWRRLASQEVGKDVSMDPAGSESCPSCLFKKPSLSFAKVNAPQTIPDLPDTEQSAVTAESVLLDCKASAIQFAITPTPTDLIQASQPDLHGEPAYVCKACGGHIYCKACGEEVNSPNVSQKANQVPGNANTERRGFRRLLKPSPLEILGADRVDPFLSYPVEKPDRSLHELMDFSKLTFFSASKCDVIKYKSVPSL
jgi:hypothetical protein